MDVAIIERIACPCATFETTNIEIHLYLRDQINIHGNDTTTQIKIRVSANRNPQSID
jgi:hypothetical protein